MNTLKLSSLPFVRPILALIAGLVAPATNSYGQGVLASAQITAQQLAGGVYNYSLALDNTGTSSLETFWFAWDLSGYDFMTVSPSSITAPSGWSGTITAVIGYGIQFNTSTSPLAPGSIINFGFNSTMTPAQMAGTSYLSTPVGISYVSTAPGFGGTQSGSFFAQVVPEPSSFAFFVTGFLGFWVARRNERRG